MFAEEIEQSLLEEHTTSEESSSSNETDSCGSDDLIMGEVNFAECSVNEIDNVQFGTGCSTRSASKGVFAWEDMTNYVGQREQFVDNYGPQNETQNETHCAKVFKMIFDDERVELIVRETNKQHTKYKPEVSLHCVPQCGTRKLSLQTKCILY
jgi:hypothetical protein